MERYQCVLEPAVLSKAVSELNEPRSNAERLAAIDSLRSQFKYRNPHIQLEKEDDIFILQFLRAEKFRNPKALERMQNYHTKIPLHPELFGKVKMPMNLEQIFDSGIVCPLESKAKDGSTVLLTRLGLYQCSLNDILCLLFLSIKNLLEEDENSQVHGFTIIHDMKLFNTTVARQFDSKMCKTMLQVLTACLPARLKKLNITNEPIIFNAIFCIVLSFVNEKKNFVVQKHGANFSKLYKSIDKTVLPLFVGGTGPDPKPALWKEKILK